MKPYENFSDIYGNKYEFDNYNDFAKFWFNLQRKTAILYFGTDFKKLNNYAVNSKGAKTKI